jgi:class 3 adenylate cyclase
MAAADAGEVLVSAAVPLATLGGRHRFEPHGQFELKGFDGTFDLFRLVPAE